MKTYRTTVELSDIGRDSAGDDETTYYAAFYDSGVYVRIGRLSLGDVLDMAGGLGSSDGGALTLTIEASE